MIKEAKEILIEHYHKFYGDSCKINFKNETITNISFIRNCEVMIFTNNVKYDDLDKYFYYYFDNNQKRIPLKNERVGRVYINELEDYMYAIILSKKDFEFSNNRILANRKLPKDYVKEYDNVFNLAAVENSKKFSIRL